MHLEGKCQSEKACHRFPDAAAAATKFNQGPKGCQASLQDTDDTVGFGVRKLACVLKAKPESGSKLPRSKETMLAI